jgi:cation diffusion facilitator CzcD-associated flavoprotein CzcO
MIDPLIQALVGDVDFDPAAIARRYAYERDVRLRPDGNHQFIETSAQFSHYVDDPYVEAPLQREPLSDEVEVVIVGGGFGGILAGARLREAGFNDIRIIEKGGDFGGTWYWNRYPGIRCDCESYIYLPLLEKMAELPSEKYIRGSEIYRHVKKLAKQYDLYRNACFQTGVTGLRWNDETSRWHIATDRGDDLRARFVAMANGPMNKPKLPGIPGIDKFKGHTFHTSRWDYSYTGGDETGHLTGLCDKRVGIIGTGATGVQCVPPLAESAQHLYVFQRTPAAVDVRANRPTDSQWASVLKPGWQDERIANFNCMVGGIPQDIDLVNDGFTVIGKLLDPTASWAAKIVGRSLTPDEGNFITDVLDDKKMIEIRARIDAVVRDSKTAEALKPWHRRWCKRPLFSDDYLPAFNRPNVTLVDTAGKGVERMTESGVVVAGREYAVDCLIFATGFEVGTEYTRRAGYEVVGRRGLKLSDHWKGGMRTLHGLHSRGFPNCLFIGFGQNAVATNFAFILDEQAKHIAYTLAQARKRGAMIVEASARAVDDYVAEVAPLSFSQHKFWVECTPSYMNGEGTSNDPHGFFANLHPAGAVGFYKMLADWRAKGDLQGLELS